MSSYIYIHIAQVGKFIGKYSVVVTDDFHDVQLVVNQQGFDGDLFTATDGIFAGSTKGGLFGYKLNLLSF